MTVKRILLPTRSILKSYPRAFWTLVVATFIDRLGGAILFPFFTLYVTQRFDVGMTSVGIIFGIFALTGMIGSTIGGALSDRFGRKWMLVLGLIMSALSSLWLGFANEIQVFVLGAVVVGLLSNIGGPAQQAMVADLLPEEQRPEGYGIIRVTFNLAVVIGPVIGGFLASRSYLSLFIVDAIGSIIVAGIVFALLPETRVSQTDDEKETITETFSGYGRVLQDRIFMVFWIAFALITIVYIQMNSTLAVFLRDSYGITERQFGFILSLNALMVVIFQFPISRRITKYAPLSVMAWGAFLYTVGFAMYGVVSDYGLFLIAMVVITIGEMLVAPVAQALVANFAPEDMRGRYMAFFGFSWSIPFAIGPFLAGLLMDYSDPRLVWFFAGVIGIIATAIFVFMHLRLEPEEEPAPQTA